MQRFLGIIFIAIVAGSPCATVPASAATAPQEPADLIVHNAKITTLEQALPEAQALAVRGETLVAVGRDEQVMMFRGDQTRVIDAGGRRVIPGLNDSHIHAVRGGRFYNLELRWDGVESLQQGLRMVRDQAKRTPKGQWVRVIGGWTRISSANDACLLSPS
jgi:predicted amidohydrolase YtcJ